VVLKKFEAQHGATQCNTVQQFGRFGAVLHPVFWGCGTSVHSARPIMTRHPVDVKRQDRDVSRIFFCASWCN